MALATELIKKAVDDVKIKLKSLMDGYYQILLDDDTSYLGNELEYGDSFFGMLDPFSEDFWEEINAKLSRTLEDLKIKIMTLLPQNANVQITDETNPLKKELEKVKSELDAKKAELALLKQNDGEAKSGKNTKETSSIPLITIRNRTVHLTKDSQTDQAAVEKVEDIPSKDATFKSLVERIPELFERPILSTDEMSKSLIRLRCVRELLQPSKEFSGTSRELETHLHLFFMRYPPEFFTDAQLNIHFVESLSPMLQSDFSTSSTNFFTNLQNFVKTMEQKRGMELMQLRRSLDNLQPESNLTSLCYKLEALVSQMFEDPMEAKYIELIHRLYARVAHLPDASELGTELVRNDKREAYENMKSWVLDHAATYGAMRSIYPDSRGEDRSIQQPQATKIKSCYVCSKRGHVARNCRRR